MADRETCEQLLEEYRALRRRTEEVRHDTNFSQQDMAHVNVSKADLDRLATVKQQLEEQCQEYLPAEEQIDIPRDNGFTG